VILILMGISGIGKTTIGKLLATRTGWTFEDGTIITGGEPAEDGRASHSTMTTAGLARHGA